MDNSSSSVMLSGETPFDVTVAIPYYQGASYLRHCLASVTGGQPGCRVEVVVVDDASPEPCRGWIADEFPSVRVIENERNLGFAGAVNVAANESRGRHLLILNSDAQFASGLARMVAILDSNPDVAAVGPRVLNLDGSVQPQCRRGHLTPLSALGYATGLDRWFPRGPLGSYLERWRSYDVQQDVAALSGACMMVRRETFERVDGLDERFILYGEDLDFCYRVAERGKRVVFSPEARTVHAGGQGGTARRFYRSKFFYWRALWILFRRHGRSRWFGLYGWLVAAGLGAGFLASCLPQGRRLRRIGTAKGNVAPSPGDWTAVVSRSDPEP